MIILKAMGWGLLGLIIVSIMGVLLVLTGSIVVYILTTYGAYGLIAMIATAIFALFTFIGYKAEQEKAIETRMYYRPPYGYSMVDMWNEAEREARIIYNKTGEETGKFDCESGTWTYKIVNPKTGYMELEKHLSQWEQDNLVYYDSEGAKDY